LTEANRAYVTPLPGASYATANPFADTRRFAFLITYQNMKNTVLLAKTTFPILANISEDPADYVITESNLNPEVTAPLSTDNAWIAVRGKIHRISVIDTTDGLPQ
jgi:hypothetical protein